MWVRAQTFVPPYHTHSTWAPLRIERRVSMKRLTVPLLLMWLLAMACQLGPAPATVAPPTATAVPATDTSAPATDTSAPATAAATDTTVPPTATPAPATASVAPTH